MIKDLSDEDIDNLNRGGHDHIKVFAAYAEACTAKLGQPTVIFSETVKGYGLSDEIEAVNKTHQIKKRCKSNL